MRTGVHAVLVLMLTSANLAAAPARRCVIEPAAAPVASAPKSAPCHRAKRPIEKAVRTELLKRYRQRHTRGRVIVTLPCDGLGAKIREITIERGNGHGGTLSMWRALRRPDGAYDVRGIRYRDRGPHSGYELAAGQATLAGIPTARAALATTVREVAPPSQPGTVSLGRIWTSSRSFHVVLRLVDDDGRTLERRYTGYADTPGQDTYLGIEVALDALAPITSISATAALPSADDRALFTDRFNAAVPHFDAQFAWWVTERYVALARHLGTRATIGGLLTRLTVGTPDRSKLAARAGAVEAIAEITGWDAREDGRSVEDAAARYLAECRGASP